MNALQSHDETLAEELDSYRRSLGKGSTISVIGSKFVFDIPAEFPEEFVSALGVRLVEKSTSPGNFITECWWNIRSVMKPKRAYAI